MTAFSINSISHRMPKKFMMLAVTLVLALGASSTIQVNEAQARHRNGGLILGAIAGVALATVLANQNRRHYKHRSRGRHYYSGGHSRRYHTHYDRYGDPYRCSRRHSRRHYRRSHRNRW